MEDREVLTVDAVTKVESFKKFPLWIIEYVWAHKTLDLQEVMASCDWPDIGSQPLNLEDSWRLRVASAQMFYIVKNRDVQHFDKVVNFLETTHRLLPRLVAPLRHMKLMFGLKTMVVMWMLQQGRTVDTMLKINQFFPRELPQYQDQCTQHERFLMKKNIRDFRTFAQTLAMNKEQRKNYMKNLMEEQYGEHYAQKVEERLLQYLQDLEEALPADTVIDKILKTSPVSEEERRLLDIISSDSASVLMTLKTLLRCDAASCGSVGSPQSPRHGQNEVETLEEPAPTLGSSGVLLRSNKDTGPMEKKKKKKKRSSSGVSGSSPQFCYKHQRWVRTILQECSDQQLPATVPSSPTLFQSSSEDLTPSGLVQQGSPSETGPAPLSGQKIHIGSRSSPPSPPGGAVVDLMDVSSNGRSSPRVSPGLVSSSDQTQDQINRPRQFHGSAAPQDDTPGDLGGPAASFSPSVDPSVCPTFTEDIFSLQSPPGLCSTPNPDPLVSRSETRQVQTRLSLQTQAVFLQSPFLQPVVNLIRIKPEVRVPGPHLEDHQDSSSSSSSSSSSTFDVNILYSSPSSSSEDSLHRDPDYEPSVQQRKRLFLDYSWFKV